jgi:microcystin-dependent protein
MDQPFIGQIAMFGFNFAPRGWAHCNGQLQAVSQNEALFSLIGTIYGGDGRTTFALPDLRGRSSVHYGNGPGLSNVALGQRGGYETTNLLTSNLPPHSHTFNLADGKGDAFSANGTGIANVALNQETGQSNELLEIFSSAGAYSGKTLRSTTIGNAGGGQSFDSRSPYLGINICIALVGVYPSRS